jgi:dolichyl-phosphate-mannose--protein O-mannosyl transferase
MTAPEQTAKANSSFPSYFTPLGVLLSVLILFGLYLRVHAFGYPSSLQFDEHHFVNNARGYLQQQPDWNDHPPLGKLIIAFGISFVGDSSVGFRIPALFAGLLTIAAGTLAAKRLFPSQWAPLFAAALLSADGFFIAYSRAALLDGFLVLSSVVAILLTTFELSLFWACLSGLLFGIAVSIKFSGLGVILPILFWVATSPKPRPTKHQAISAILIVASLSYVFYYSIGLSMTHKPSGVIDVLRDTERLLKHHADLTEMKHPVTSGWVTWFLPTKPIFLGISEKFGAVRALTTLGNLATWWGSVFLAFSALAVVLREGFRSVLSRDLRNHTDPLTAFVFDHGKAVITLWLTTLGFLAPWVMTHRDSYIYHFLPAYAPLVLMLTGFLSWAEKRWPSRVLLMVSVVVLVAAFYAPLWAYIPLSRNALVARLFLPSWR